MVDFNVSNSEIKLTKELLFYQNSLRVHYNYCEANISISNIYTYGTVCSRESCRTPTRAEGEMAVTTCPRVASVSWFPRTRS